MNTPEPWITDYDNVLRVTAVEGTQSFLPVKVGGALELDSGALVIGNVEFVGPFDYPTGGQVVAVVYREEDAPLLAAAPRLLAACKDLLEAITNFGSDREWPLDLALKLDKYQQMVDDLLEGG